MILNQSMIFRTQNNLLDEVEDHINSLIGDKENNPDFFLLEISKKQSIGIKEVKEMTSWLQTKPFQSKNKLAIIREAEKLTTESQNALLKTLEEPPQSSYIFLLTKNPKSMLPTILSRVSIINIRTDEEVDDSEYKDLEDLLKSLSKQMDLIKDITEIKDGADKKDQIRLLVQDLHNWILIRHENQHTNLVILEQTIEALNRNVNTKLILENLLFNLQ